MRALARARSHRTDLVDALLVVVLLVSAQYEVWVGPLFQEEVQGPRAANAVLLALACLALLGRRSRPAAAFVVATVAVAVQSQVEAHGGALNRTDLGTMQGWIVTLVAFYSVAANAAPRRATVVAVLVGVGWVATDLGSLLAGSITLEETVPGWFILGAAWGLGYALRSRRHQVTALTDRTVRLEHEREARAQAAVAAERERIARELHDVVAHSLSVMVVQAQAADRVLDGDHPSAREAIASIDTTGRQALAEMRRLVGLLRERDERGGLGLAPQPGLGQLGVLLDQVRDAGLPVELAVEGEPRPLAPGIDLSAYRIVQEALTNALKHAGPARASVRLRYGERDMEVEVLDDGAGPRHAGAGGHGLLGIGERVALYGGVLESGARNGRGFRVSARLPA